MFALHTLHVSFVYKLLWATIVVHSKDDKELGMAYETTAPELYFLRRWGSIG